MARRVIIRTREYHDSVRLMRISEALRHETGVTEAMVMMATPNNKKILETSGLLTEDAVGAAPDDLIIAVVAESEEAADAAIEAAKTALSQKAQNTHKGIVPRTLDAAVSANPQANLACISVPGAFAFREAKRALELGLNVFLFSDNVSLDDELKLKQLAVEKNRLMMGPDCGTALIGGVALGFANAVRRGKIGIVGASGTGIQEISSLLETFGVGVSHAIGTGGRDLRQEIGGLMMLQGLALLAEDPGTEVIVVTSKPPAPDIADKILAYCETIGKPIVVNFVGQDREGQQGRITFTRTQAQTAEAAARLFDATATLPSLTAEERAAFVASAKASLAPWQRYVRGLYSGGTLCYEALFIAADAVGPVYSNLAKGEYELTDLFISREHTIIDLGEDAYTQGRAHPMIDLTVRNQRILREAEDPSTAVLLLDVVIGYGAHENPAKVLAETLKKARAITDRAGRGLPVIATICGTRADPQGFEAQAAQLREAGVLVASNNAEAASVACQLLREIHAQHA